MTTPPFDERAARARVAGLLSLRPAQPHIVRPTADGVLVGSWVLPAGPRAGSEPSRRDALVVATGG
jgi:hypothetical protein